MKQLSWSSGCHRAHSPLDSAHHVCLRLQVLRPADIQMMAVIRITKMDHIGINNIGVNHAYLIFDVSSY